MRQSLLHKSKLPKRVKEGETTARNKDWRDSKAAKRRLVNTIFDFRCNKMAKLLNGAKVKVYLDTDSKYNLISQDCVEKLCKIVTMYNCACIKF